MFYQDSCIEMRDLLLCKDYVVFRTGGLSRQRGFPVHILSGPATDTNESRITRKRTKCQDTRTLQLKLEEACYSLKSGCHPHTKKKKKRKKKNFSETVGERTTNVSFFIIISQSCAARRNTRHRDKVEQCCGKKGRQDQRLLHCGMDSTKSAKHSVKELCFRVCLK